MDKYIYSFREMISLRGLTDHTLKSYTTYIKTYLNYVQEILCKDPSDVTWQEIRDFLLWVKSQKGLSDRTINHITSQIRFFTIYVLHKEWDKYQVPYRKFDTKLPFIPTRDEMSQFFHAIPDLKFRAFFALLYSSGLRVREACSLRCSDIQMSRNRIRIPVSKSRSEQFAPLNEHALRLLISYWKSLPKDKRPYGDQWLFPCTRKTQNPMPPAYAERMILKIEKSLGWPHRFTCHTFRHAYATFLYEDGADIIQIQKLLRHKSLASTMIYVHLATLDPTSIPSPFDEIGGDLS